MSLPHVGQTLDYGSGIVELSNEDFALLHRRSHQRSDVRYQTRILRKRDWERPKEVEPQAGH
jgi:hypothetical protein